MFIFAASNLLNLYDDEEKISKPDPRLKTKSDIILFKNLILYSFIGLLGGGINFILFRVILGDHKLSDIIPSTEKLSDLLEEFKSSWQNHLPQNNFLQKISNFLKPHKSKYMAIFVCFVVNFATLFILSYIFGTTNWIITVLFSLFICFILDPGINSNLIPIIYNHLQKPWQIIGSISIVYIIFIFLMKNLKLILKITFLSLLCAILVLYLYSQRMIPWQIIHWFALLLAIGCMICIFI